MSTKSYREKHRSKIAQIQRAYYQKYKDRLRRYAKEYNLRNKDQVSQQRKEHYQLNREAKIRKSREYYQANKAAIQRKNTERRRRYRQTPEGRAALQRENRRRYQAIRDWTLRKKFGIGIEQFEELLKKQHHRCAICGVKEDGQKLDVDHCHKTKKVRGLLCRSCNIGLGMFKDDQKILHAAYLYAT
jgi:hypothetical protein